MGKDERGKGMDRQETTETLKRCLRDFVERITQRSKGRNMYNCPLCGSGNGHNGTGAFSIKDETTWKCFSCGEGGDIFDLYGGVYQVKDHGGQYAGLCQLYGLQDASTRVFGTTTHARTHAKPAKEEAEADYTDFFLQAHKAIGATDYWEKRGLSRGTVDRFKLGFVAEWRHPKAPNAPASPRLIIPTGRGSYLARDTRDDLTAEQKPYSKSKVGKTQIFNAPALWNAQKPVFVVEGEVDALSIIEAGGEAVALGSTTNRKALVEMLAEKAPRQALIISMDNDEAGQKASVELVKGLQALNIPCYAFNPCGEHKDANEALQRDRNALAVAISEGEALQSEEERQKKEAYLKTSTANYLQNFINGIADNATTESIPTGFSSLDSVLDGGLYEGLYIFGAISSLGKTTLVLQIADQIAQAGQSVLIFSLEMGRNELIAKSISRITLQITQATGGNMDNAKTARGITTGKRYSRYSEAEKSLIREATEAYSEYAQQIYISEGVGDIGVDQIRETVKQHILYTGQTPVVIVDYLQILAPYSERATDKQNTDKAVLELKRISRDYKTPVIGISSFNRASYREAVTMEAFKESGAIEYSSDILIGLQLKGAGGQNFDANEAKRKSPREIELVVLKNRNGKTGETVCFSYYPMFNCFEEKRNAQPTTGEAWRATGAKKRGASHEN